MEQGNQVLPCSTCRENTLHRQTPPDGHWRCWKCTPNVDARPHYTPPKTKARTVTFRVGTLLLIGALVIVAGFTHVVHGGSSGLTVCGKDGWSLSDTFVDVDDYVGKSLIELAPKAKVVRALFACSVLQRPAWLDGR